MSTKPLTKAERQSLRNELVCLARDVGGMHPAHSETKELIERCMGEESPVSAMQAALEARKAKNSTTAENQPPKTPPELPTEGVSIEQTKGGEVPPEGQSEALTETCLEAEKLFVNLPMAEGSPLGYQTEHVQLRLTNRQRENLSRLFHGLRGEHAQMENGHHVDNAVDAVRWVLEKLPNMLVKAETNAA